MNSQKILVFAFAMIIIAGCTGQQINLQQNNEAGSQGNIDYLQKAESLRGSFFYTGECDAKCEAVIDAFEDAVDYAKTPEAKALAQQKLAEFLFWLKNYEGALDYARQLSASADPEYKCSGQMLMGNVMRQMGRDENALGYFYSARDYCQDKSAAESSICYIYADLGRKDDADGFCKPYYS